MNHKLISTPKQAEEAEDDRGPLRIYAGDDTHNEHRENPPQEDQHTQKPLFRRVSDSLSRGFSVYSSKASDTRRQSGNRLSESLSRTSASLSRVSDSVSRSVTTARRVSSRSIARVKVQMNQATDEEKQIVLTKDLKEINKTLNSTTFQLDLAKARKEKPVHEAAAATLDAKITKVTATIAHAKYAIEKINKGITDMRAEIQRCQNKMDAIAMKADTAQNRQQIDALDEDCQELQVEIQAAKEEGLPQFQKIISEQKQVLTRLKQQQKDNTETVHAHTQLIIKDATLTERKAEIEKELEILHKTSAEEAEGLTYL